MSSVSVTQAIARYIVDLKYEDLPRETIAAAKEAVLDQLGIMLMGSTLPWTRPSYELVLDLGSRPEATIVGRGGKVSALDAAFVNANLGHSCEFDDSGYNGGCHPGALTVPTALALAEKHHLSGQELLLSVVLGYEIMSRIGGVMGRAVLDKGFHHQTVIGPFGAAAVAGKLLRLDADTMVHALAIAGSHSSGTMEYDQAGGEVKRLHSSIAVRGGMMAVLLAQRGLTGPRTILEGLRGIPRVFAGIENVAPIVENLDRRDWFAVQGRIVKFFPTVGTIHTAIQAIARLMEEQSLRPEQVDAIHIGVGPLTVSHGGAIYRPTDTISAQFSLAFSLALRLVKGRNDLGDYMNPKLWKDPEIVALIERIHVHPDARMVGDLWCGAWARVVLRDGRVLETEQLYRKGSPQQPLTWDELAGKFRRLACAALDEQGAQRIAATVNRLDQVEDVAALLPLGVGPR
ncbi:MAG: MmgE/PrpD family protein [Burkholderiales bacterium]|nr:MmgE/PrpD family protein [Burkholderiales bacterium]